MWEIINGVGWGSNVSLDLTLSLLSDIERSNKKEVWKVVYCFFNCVAHTDTAVMKQSVKVH